ncbi:MAG: NAD(P)-dependent oxidoreductase, partial [Akkermansiaceae bacterium]
MQHLTFLDSSTMGDTALTPLVDFGRFQHYDTTAPEEVIERLQDTNIAITNKVIIGEETMRACKNLKLICVAATGTNCVDLAAAEKAGIPVCNVAGYSTASVTQHAIGLLINLASSMHRYAAEATLWSASPIFTRLDHPMTDLGGKTLGVAGLGNIGRSVAKAAQGLGMRVIALQRENASETPDPATEIPRVSKAEFFSQSDAISLHCPLTESTRNMINAETL